MPEFRQAADIEVEHHGKGWTVSVLADQGHVPGIAMVARRWIFEPGALGPQERWEGPAERFLYVIAGSGRLHAGGTFELERECVVWLEPGERYRIVAGTGRLEILEATSVPA